MRGVAALAVVWMHSKSYMGPAGIERAYLAVDLFFVLSGLVISRAYAGRLDAGMSARDFMVIRLIRLYPLYALGTATGIVLVLLAQSFGAMVRPPPLAEATSFLAAALMLPDPLPIETKGWLSPYNIAAWSLIFELAANWLLVVTWRWLDRRTLIAILVVSGAVLIGQTLIHGDADVGSKWSTAPLGVARAAFSFFLGVALGRAPDRPVHHTGWAILLPLALIPTFLPRMDWVGGWYDVACIFVVYPLLVFWGSSIEPRRANLFAFLGLISFAIYATHQPLIMLAGLVLRRLPPWMAVATPWIGIVLIALYVAFAWAADLFFDRPVRAWLTRRLHTPRSAAR